MASTVPLQILDDDDEYDWDAAVREIDAACEKNFNKLSSSSSAAATATATSTISFQNTNSYIGSCPKIESNKPNSSRQSTLDNVFDLRATATSTIAFQNTNSHMGSCPKIENNKPNSSRQSTLDKFIGRTESKSINQNVRHDVEDTDLCDDERVSSVSIDPEAAKTWIYPENVTVRDYQLSITKTALFSNTLVSLPTGLGKTLIAAVVMYNYYRWFPEGKIVFAAPSRPLVLQQIEACHNIVGIPQEYTVDMTGQTCPSKRASLWISKRIFFVTPQVLERDLQSGSCTVKQLVCLVIDEAHRASGNYSYCVVVRELMAVSVQLRILALTATPGSDHQTVQQVIDNLQISSLEFRSESDPEVIPFVYDKKIELIKVEMGNDAVEVNNLLMDVISPFTQKLSSMGLLPKRDPRTFSQCDFLNSREAFRQTPRHDLSHMKDKIEGMYAVLLTLYHIRKLLSVHGIQSAFEMLEDKLKQRSFASLMSRNENLWKVKVKMQENISHGALSPKFSKMLEVLVEHFKKNDPQKSRVMIFSNYRNSVRDIMSSVATIGAYVKATEFIGQNSGKTSKGQSQKVQQAVLEKFRAGGYNVIVATSIGEEGLDIMEVDLVICFDSNISPVRMIQRMGRTGRKSKGRVVFLAYEGSEARGYKNKQGKSKNLEKLMINGGTSFHFHSSPRMVPHVFRPEKVFVKFVIEQFIPRGKKLKEDNAIQTPRYKLELTEFESDMLANYFDPLKEDDWRPSLIAFPHFQAFRSRVHKVSHSTRTCMLIDTMQCLQGLSFSNHSKSLYGQDKETSEECFRVETIEHHDDNTREEDLTRKEPDDILSQHPPSHSFLFGSDFTSVDSLGRVLILSVPSFPLKNASPIKVSSPPNTKPVFLNCSKSDSSHLKASHKEHSEIASVVDCVFCDLATSPDTVFHTENVNLEVINREFSTKESSSADVDTGSVDESSIDSKGADLSPRLTNFLMSGVVPESPIDNGTSSQAKDYCTTPDLNMLPDTSISLVQIKNDEGIENKTPNRSMPREVQTLQNELRNNSSDKHVSSSKIVGEIRTPLTNLSNKSGSKDWILSSGEKSISQPKQRLKRLRRHADIKSGNLLENKEIVRHSSVSGRSRAQFHHPFDKHSRGNERLLNEAKVFIEDEAEVSSEASGDEEIDIEQDSYGGSFIDDRINPTMASTQAETAQCDMMAIYRRSLLSQSPIVNQSPENIVSIDQTHDYGDSVIATTTDEIWKRKSSSSEGGSLPICNLENEIFSKQDAALQMDEFDNDDFFEDIDLDALEEQAAKQLRSKSEVLNEKPNDENLGFLDCPSFDLGI